MSFSDSVWVGCKFWCCLIISIITKKLLFAFNAKEALFCETGDQSLSDCLSWILNWLEDYPQSGFFEEFLLCFLLLSMNTLPLIISPEYFCSFLFSVIKFLFINQLINTVSLQNEQSLDSVIRLLFLLPTCVNSGVFNRSW